MENKIDLVDDKTEVEKLCFETMRAIAEELGGSVDDTGFGYTIKARNVGNYNYYEVHIHDTSVFEEGITLDVSIAISDVDYDDEDRVEELKKTRPNIENEFIHAWDQFDLGISVDEALLAKFIRAYEGKVREIAEELDIELDSIDEDKLSMLEDDIEEQLREAVQAVL